MVLVIFESKESEKTMTIQTRMLKKPLSLDKGGGYGKSSISLGALDLLGFFCGFSPYQSSSSYGTMQGQGRIPITNRMNFWKIPNGL